MSHSKIATPAPNLRVSDQALHLMLHGTSGSVAGVLAAMLLYPIDNIKTRLQAMAKLRDSVPDTDSESPQIAKTKKSQKVVEVIKEIIENEGVLGLYKGMSPFLLGTLVSFGVYFFWYEFCKGHFIKDKFSLLGYSITALIAGLATATCANPFWVIHTRMLFEKEKSPELIATVKHMLSKEGIEGLYKGIGAAYILVANPIIQFVIYEYLKKKFPNNKSSFIVFLIGALSKALATLVTYPYSTLKTNIQVNKHREVTQMEVIKEIFESKGIKGFFSGFGPKMSQTVINSALMLMIYERIQAIIKATLLAILSKK